MRNIVRRSIASGCFQMQLVYMCIQAETKLQAVEFSTGRIGSDNIYIGGDLAIIAPHQPWGIIDPIRTPIRHLCRSIPHVFRYIE